MLIALVATGWTAWVLSAGWASRPLPVQGDLPIHAPDGRVRVVERWGRRAQRRLTVLGELPAGVVGVTLAVVGAVAAIAPSTSLLVGLGLITIARTRSISRQRAEARAAVAQAPAVVDLLALCLDAGLSARHAVERVAPLVGVPLGADLAAAAGRCSDGAALAEALAPLSVRGHPLRAAVLAIVGAERSGAPVVGALDRVATEARAAVRRTTEERARRLPVVMLFPLVCCVLPAFGLITIAPLVLGRLGDLL